MEAISIVVLIAAPLLGFIGGLVGHLLGRRSDVETDRWRKREETMRMLRWAAELATDPDQMRAAAGLTVLDALLDSPLLDDADVAMVSTITGTLALTTRTPPALPEGQSG